MRLTTKKEIYLGKGACLYAFQASNHMSLCPLCGALSMTLTDHTDHNRSSYSSSGSPALCALFPKGFGVNRAIRASHVFLGISLAPKPCVPRLVAGL